MLRFALPSPSALRLAEEGLTLHSPGCKTGIKWVPLRYIKHISGVILDNVFTVGQII